MLGPGKTGSKRVRPNAPTDPVGGGLRVIADVAKTRSGKRFKVLLAPVAEEPAAEPSAEEAEPSTEAEPSATVAETCAEAEPSAIAAEPSAEAEPSAAGEPCAAAEPSAEESQQFADDEPRPASPVIHWGPREQDDDFAEGGAGSQASSRPWRPRSATRGVMLDQMTSATGRRLRISVAEGLSRPHEPTQATKFASEAGVIVRTQVSILPHWKDYKDTNHIDSFVGSLSSRLAMNTKDRATGNACSSVFKSGIRQMRYRLKQQYFNNGPADQIRTTSPVPSMSDA